MNGRIMGVKKYTNLAQRFRYGFFYVRRSPVLAEIVVAKENISKGSFGEFVYMGATKV
jgi:hypothetical protein